MHLQHKLQNSLPCFLATGVAIATVLYPATISCGVVLMLTPCMIFYDHAVLNYCNF